MSQLRLTTPTTEPSHTGAALVMTGDKTMSNEMTGVEFVQSVVAAAAAAVAAVAETAAAVAAAITKKEN